MKKKLALTLSVMLVLAVAICSFALTASAETNGQGTITYVESDGTTTHTINATTTSAGGISYDPETDTVTLTNVSGGTVTFNFAKEYTVILVGDNALSKVTANGADSTLIIDGDGTLTVEAGVNSLIRANGNLKIMGGTVIAKDTSGSGQYTIDVVGALTIENSTVKATSGSNQAILAKNGISIENAHVEATAGGNNCLYANGTGDLTITGENTYVKATANACAIIVNGGNLAISGGTVIAEAKTGDGALAAATTGCSISISGGNVTATGPCRVLKSATVNLTGGDVTANVNVAEGATGIYADLFANNNATTLTIGSEVHFTLNSNEHANWEGVTVVDDGVFYVDGRSWDNNTYTIETVVDAGDDNTSSDNTSDDTSSDDTSSDDTSSDDTSSDDTSSDDTSSDDTSSDDTSSDDTSTDDTSDVTLPSSTDKDLSVDYEEATPAATVYDFDIFWENEDYAFNYDAGVQGDWNPDNLEYGDVTGAGWTDDDLNVTIVNRSNADIAVALSVTDADANDGLTVSCPDYSAADLVSAEGKTEATLSKVTYVLKITGTPTAAIEKVATVTIAVSAASN